MIATAGFHEVYPFPGPGLGKFPNIVHLGCASSNQVAAKFTALTTYNSS